MTYDSREIKITTTTTTKTTQATPDSMMHKPAAPSQLHFYIITPPPPLISLKSVSNITHSVGISRDANNNHAFNCVVASKIASSHATADEYLIMFVLLCPLLPHSIF